MIDNQQKKKWKIISRRWPSLLTWGTPSYSLQGQDSPLDRFHLSSPLSPLCKLAQVVQSWKVIYQLLLVRYFLSDLIRIKRRVNSKIVRHLSSPPLTLSRKGCKLIQASGRPKNRGATIIFLQKSLDFVPSLMTVSLIPSKVLWTRVGGGGEALVSHFL